jgi:ubiquinone biosynthesis UbiH/UbiF/VisC/COQ6 family hydroxylase
VSLRDVTVIGGGMVGAATANLLARAGLSVTLVNDGGPPAWDPSAPVGLRVSAISPGSEAILEQAGAWPRIAAARCCAYRRMQVEDGQGSGGVEFEAAVFGFDHLGTIVENDLVTHALWDGFGSAPGLEVVAPARVAGVRQDTTSASCELEDGRQIASRLLIGADGPRSAVRRSLGLASDAWEYNQRGLVARVKKSRPNPGIAWQRFLPGGPLAFLPLADGWSSIVWTLPDREARELQEVEPESFDERLAIASEGWLGDVEETGPRASFPLAMSLGERYVSGRVVLLGDAAHAIHPLAGQGVNLGLADAAALVETLVRQRTAGASLAEPAALARFDRWRRSESTLMAGGIHGLGTLFRPALLAPLRRLGLSAVARSWALREAFLRRAAGTGPGAPRLARGAMLGELGAPGD